MRKGQNPAKFVNTVAKPANITVAVLSYIPYLSGFYGDALKVPGCMSFQYQERIKIRI